MKIFFSFLILTASISSFAQTLTSDAAKLIFSPRPSNSIGYNPPSLEIDGMKLNLFLASPAASRYVRENILSDVSQNLNYDGNILQAFVVRLKGQCMKYPSIVSTVGDKSYANEPKKCEEGDFFVLQTLSNLDSGNEKSEISTNGSERSEGKDIIDLRQKSSEGSLASEA